MTGPEHYREAEKALAQASKGYGDPAVLALDLQSAQVHATLALAAATALGAQMNNGASAADGASWDAITKRKRGGR